VTTSLWRDVRTVSLIRLELALNDPPQRYPRWMRGTGRAQVGRPRQFGVDEALEQALRVFWSKGFEGATLAELTDAMNISKASLYATFGTKDELFQKVVDRYTDGPASYGARALEEATARKVAQALLHGAATTTTQDDDPQGCLGVQGALVTGSGGTLARDVLVEWRRAAGGRLETRFRRALVEGDLPESTDPHELALFVMSVAYGIAVQAATGTSSEELHLVAERALTVFV
jgi:AcrR family transcriptional regulator